MRTQPKCCTQTRSHCWAPWNDTTATLLKHSDTIMITVPPLRQGTQPNTDFSHPQPCPCVCHDDLQLLWRISSEGHGPALGIHDAEGVHEYRARCRPTELSGVVHT